MENSFLLYDKESVHSKARYFQVKHFEKRVFRSTGNLFKLRLHNSKRTGKLLFVTYLHAPVGIILLGASFRKSRWTGKMESRLENIFTYLVMLPE